MKLLLVINCTSSQAQTTGVKLHCISRVSPQEDSAYGLPYFQSPAGAETLESTEMPLLLNPKSPIRNPKSFSIGNQALPAAIDSRLRGNDCLLFVRSQLL